MSSYRIEAWSLPDPGPHEKVAAGVPWAGASFTDDLDNPASSRGSVTVPYDWTRLDDVCDEHSGTETILKIFDENNNVVGSFFARERSDPWDFRGKQYVTITGPAMVDILDFAIFFPYDAPFNLDTWDGTSTFPDWIFGSEQNYLTNGDLEDPTANEIGNGDLETGETTPWRATAGATIAMNVTGLYIRNGSYSLKVDPTEEATGAGQTLTVVPGQEYAITAWVMCPTVGTRIVMGVQAEEGHAIKGSNNFTIDKKVYAELDNASPGSGSSTGAWQSITVWLDVGVDQETMSVDIMYYGPLSNGPEFYIDDVTTSGYGIGTAPWIANNDIVEHLYRSDTVYRSGSYSLAFQTSTAFTGVRQNIDAAKIPENTTVTVRGWVYTAETGSPQVQMSLRQLDDKEIASQYRAIPQYTWTEFEVTATTVVKGLAVEFRYTSGGSGSMTFYVDDVFVSPGEPANTPGYIAALAIDDVTLSHSPYRAHLQYLKYDSFDDTDDSSGQAWDDDEVAITIPRGQTLRRFFDSLGKLGYEYCVEWNSTDSEYEVKLYNPGNRGVDRTALASPHVTQGIPVVDGSVSNVNPVATFALTEGQGFIFDKDAAILRTTQYGRREIYRGDKTITDPTTLQKFTTSTLAEQDPSTGFRLSFPLSGPLTFGPEGDLWTGDLVKTTRGTGATSARVMRVTMKLDSDPAKSVATVDFGARVIARREAGSVAINRLLDRFESLDPTPVEQSFFEAAKHIPSLSTNKIDPSLFVASSEATADERAAADYVCDGTDDHVEIQLAIDAMIAWSGYGRVVLSGGTFYCTENILCDVIELVGVGPSQTTIQFANGTYSGDGAVDAPYGCRDLGIYTSLSSGTQPGSALRGGQFGNYDNLYIVWQASGWSSAPDGAVDLGNGGKLTGSTIWSTVTGYAAVITPQDSTVSTAKGLCVISNNQIDLLNGGLHGVLVRGHGASLVGNIIRRSVGDGIRVIPSYSGYDGASEVQIVGNRIYDSGADGISLEHDGGGSIVTGNIILDSTVDGISIAAASSENIIGPNRINGSGGSDINDLASDTVHLPYTPDVTDVSVLTTKGDLWGYSTADARIPIGSNDDVLTADSTQALGVKWAAPASQSPLTTKGDLFGYGTDDDRLPVGSNGDRLTPDSGETTGLRWDTPASGEIHISSSAATTISAANTPTKAAGTTTLETTPAAVGFSMPANNRLRYDGTETKKFQVTVTFTATSASANQLLAFHLAENGTVNPKTEIGRYVQTANQEGAGGIVGLFELATDDYVEVFVENKTGANNITLEYMTMVVVEVP